MKRLEKDDEWKVRKNKYGSFVSVDRNFDYFKNGLIGKAIEKYRGNLAKRNIRAALSTLYPEASGVYRSNIMFLDIENCGLSLANPIFMIGMAHLNHDIDSELLFARDPSEEAPIIYETIKRIKEYKERGHCAFITYNGTSFDIPRITARARHNGILFNGSSNLMEWIEERHFDLIKFARKVKGILKINKASLQNVERALCGEETRLDDIAGRYIPEIYREYIYGVDKKGNKLDEKATIKNIVKAMNHNFYDVLTPIAFLGWLCSNTASLEKLTEAS